MSEYLIISIELKKYVQNSGAADDILSAFMGFYEKRQALLPYRERLQDIPMLQVINKYSDFAEYLFIV